MLHSEDVNSVSLKWDRQHPRRPITYILAGVPKAEREGAIFHLLNKSDVFQLRCLMTLLSLPYDLSELNPNYPSFACALGRLLHAPTFVRAPSDIKWSGADWQHLKNSSAVIVLINGPIPSWVRELAACRPVGILTPEEIVASESQLITGVHTALLKGFEDLVESYRVLSQIVTVEAANAALQEEERAFLENLSRVDLFRSRPRLSFIPPIPLPQDLRWRPAAYLLNRLSNNVDNPSL